MPTRAYEPPLIQLKTNGEKRCQTLIKRGTRKPGSFSQCRNTVASDKRKYCEKHNTQRIYIR